MTPLLHTLPSPSAAFVVWSLSEQLVRTTLASPPLLCAALGSNLFPVRTHTSAIHGRFLQVRRAAKPRGSQKEAGSAALQHSDLCFFQSVRGALGSLRCPRWSLLGALARSPVTASHKSRAPGHVSGPVAARSRPPRRPRSQISRSARQNSGALRRNARRVNLCTILVHRISESVLVRNLLSR